MLITLARKPLIGSVVQNALTHGCGVLDVDGCRVAFAEGASTGSAASVGKGSGRATANHGAPAFGKGLGGVVASPHGLGRWPANVLLGPGMTSSMDQKSGILHSQDPATRNGKPGKLPDGQGVTYFGVKETRLHFADTGGASRFFWGIPPR